MSDPGRGPRESEPAADRWPVEPPRAVLCDEGELDDLYALLCGLDAHPLRLRPADLADLRAWERPSRLWITSVRVALSHDLPRLDAPPDGVAIAVADSDSLTQCTAMLRRGYRYVVRRPVHPEALRLLLMQVLWRGRENRVVARFPFGAEIGWRRGLRSGRCTMVEISAHGCRLICREPFRLGDRLRLRVPAALTGSRDLRLRGRILRRDRLPVPGGSDPQLAVQFESLSARSLAHLDALLAERASGPAVVSGAQPSRAAGTGGRHARRGRSRFPSLTETQAAPPAAPAVAPEPERRRRPRGAWQQEVLALARDSDRVLHTLLGSDLSTGGVRVEPHPLLRLGDRLRLALYDAGRVEPLVLEARVAHDQGRRGLGLVFVEVGDAAQRRLAELVAALPPLTTLGDDGEKPRALVLGEIVALGPDRWTSAARPEQQQGEPQHDHGAADHDDEEAQAAGHEPG